ncbi:MULTISPECIES: hypothetical protein [Pseudomonas]|uniref:Uncharacterized protein n=1 Tax=Pseudomonas chlororaphis TaxID=587753 RepID=A0AAQ1JBX7_9PSED|nr:MULTISPECIES: hypothetical protein [Pseudomonas]AVO59279.1 hypothetical protein C6Q18_15345 [Pseudomonas chlororaphis subsp. piscium]AZC31219.1 hypothetical protein C4K38_3259 [Pseudomonas chlororaphis subsp. piscium]AZC37658.1 hypothetical protein C4K37_3271 [Pseudomonas chlororaphis subsp. piscium]AZC44206.1 hypothetical protein C4K36_3281 [Pseudomonas chlororaphis subsp. piscium]AZC50866.1 hypothetical protein C4K35_3283 [Pseudomonas chlororaphis subsp. piscium]
MSRTERFNRELANNARLFAEADRLDVQAYELLNTDHVDDHRLALFSSAKQRANEKYLEARNDWLRIKQLMDSTD